MNDEEMNKNPEADITGDTASDQSNPEVLETSEEEVIVSDSMPSETKEEAVEEATIMESSEDTSKDEPEESSRLLVSELDNVDPDLLSGEVTETQSKLSRRARIKMEKTSTPNNVAPIEIDISNKPKDYPSDAEVPVKKGLKKGTGIGLLIFAIIVVAIAIGASIFYDAGYRDKIISPLSINDSAVDSAEFSFMYHYILIDNGVDVFAAGTLEMLNGPSEDPNFATTRDYFLDMTAREMRTTQILYDDARAHGYDIEEEHYTLARAYVDWLSLKAEDIGVPLDTYIRGVFGSQVDQQVVVNTLAKKYFAEDYADDAKLVELSATEEQAEEAYQNNRNAYDVVSYKILRITYEQRDQAFIDTANLHASQIIASMAGDPSTFESCASVYFSGAAQEILATPDSTLVSDARFVDFTHDTFRDWLFDTSRTSGDATIFADEDGFPIILVFVDRERQSIPLRDIRFAYIPIQSVDGGIGLPVSEAQMLAQEIYDSVEDETDMQEIENRYNDQVLSGCLTVTHSTDTYPGKYEGIIGSWTFDSIRVAGDKAFLETEDGYYIIYLVDISTNPEWYDRVNSFIRMNNYQAFMNELEAEYTYSFNSVGLSEIQDVP